MILPPIVFPGCSYGCVSQEVRCHAGVDKSSSILPKSRILIKKPLACQCQKNDNTKQFLCTCKRIFGGRYAVLLHRHFYWNRVWVTGVGRSSSSYPKGRILIDKPLAGLACSKDDNTKQFSCTCKRIFGG